MMSRELKIYTFVFYLFKRYAKEAEPLWEGEWEKEVSRGQIWNAWECMMRMLGGADGWRRKWVEESVVE